MHILCASNDIPDRSGVYLQCTLQVLLNPSSVAGGYTARVVYTIHCRMQGTLPVHCLYTHGQSNAKQTQTAGGTLHIHFSLCSVVAVYTAQSIQPTCSHKLLVHCSHTACALYFGLGCKPIANNDTSLRY